MEVFFNMAVIFLNFVGVAIYFALALIFAVGPAFLGAVWWIMVNVFVSERPKLNKRPVLWGTLGFFIGLIVAIFLYSLIFTTLPDAYWYGPFLPGDVWMGGMR